MKMCPLCRFLVFMFFYGCGCCRRGVSCALCIESVFDISCFCPVLMKLCSPCCFFLRIERFQVPRQEYLGSSTAGGVLQPYPRRRQGVRSGGDQRREGIILRSMKCDIPSNITPIFVVQQSKLMVPCETLKALKIYPVGGKAVKLAIRPIRNH